MEVIDGIIGEHVLNSLILKQFNIFFDTLFGHFVQAEKIALGVKQAGLRRRPKTSFILGWNDVDLRIHFRFTSICTTSTTSSYLRLMFIH